MLKDIKFIAKKSSKDKVRVDNISINKIGNIKIIDINKKK